MAHLANPALKPTGLLDPAGILRELGRREARARDLELVETALYIAGLACPFPMRVVWEPHAERLSIIAGRGAIVRLAHITAEEAHRMSTDHIMAQRLTAVTLGKRAADAYRALEPLPHDHQLGDS
jgi:hypothetical protein